MILVAGVVTVRVARQFDTFPIPFVSSTTRQGEISLSLGGTGWTTARTLRSLGTAVTLATYVGADPLGQFAAQGLRADGLYGPTTLVCESQPRGMVLYDRSGRRCGASDLRSTPELRFPKEIAESALDGHCTGAVLTNIGFTRSLIHLAVARGIPFATDLHLFESERYNADWLAAATVIARSHETLGCAPAEWIRGIWRKYGTEVVLVGCGGDGLVAGERSTGRIWHVEAVAPRGVRFAGGAGDTLLAAFVRHYFERDDVVAAARKAVLVAGWKVGGHPDESPGISARALDDLHRWLPAVNALR